MKGPRPRGGESPAASLCIAIPDSELKKPATRKHQRMDQKTLTEVLSLSQGVRRDLPAG